jgi:hypothetical protein
MRLREKTERPFRVQCIALRFYKFLARLNLPISRDPPRNATLQGDF